MSLLKKSNLSSQAVDPYELQISAQSIDFLYRNMIGIVSGVVLLPIGTLLVMWGRIDHSFLIAWFCVINLVALARILLSRAYFRHAPSPEEARHWGNYYSMTSLAHSICWVVAIMLFYVQDSPLHQIFLFLSIIGLATGSIILNAYWIVAYYVFTIPILLAASFRLAIEGGATNIGMAVFLGMYLIVNNQIAHSMRRAIWDAFRLRFENLDLVEQLRHEKNKAEIANSDKTRFLASASHDLRQPVHALTLFSDALSAEVHSKKGKSLLGNVERSIDVLNQLLGSLLDISKLDANIVKPNLEHFSLKILCDVLHAEYAPQAQEKGLAFRVRTDGNIVVFSDRVLLGTMLRNLISNAIRYTNTGSIQIICTRQSDKVRFEVCDTGVGIPKEHKQEIFREFYQLSNPERDRSKGLGLGLAIVDRLAALLNHEIEVDSKLGEGSCFAIKLPAGNLEAASLLETTHSSSGQHDILGMRIIVIDDEQVVREGTQAVLDNWGCITVLAGSEEEALEKLKDAPPPQAIIADFRLRDEKTGVQAIESLRRKYGKEIPALIITGDTDPERLREAQESGHTLMHKPVQPAKLRAYLRRVQRRKE